MLAKRLLAVLILIAPAWFSYRELLDTRHLLEFRQMAPPGRYPDAKVEDLVDVDHYVLATALADTMTASNRHNANAQIALLTYERLIGFLLILILALSVSTATLLWFIPLDAFRRRLPGLPGPVREPS